MNRERFRYTKSYMKSSAAGSNFTVGLRNHPRLFRYLDEQVFRYNFRELAHDGLRFEQVASHLLGKRLTYAEVTGKVGATPSLPN